MNVAKMTKTLVVFLALTSLVACSSSSEEATQAAGQQSESGVDATTRRAQEMAAERAAREAEAAERMRQAALNTNVFYFDFDVAEFRQADREVLTFHARDMAANSSKRIRLEGHADERGTREYNLALGERRANAILNYLIVNGAARTQIEVVSYGEERPADAATSENAYQLNRRVEIVAP